MFSAFWIMSVNVGNSFCTFSDAVTFGQRVKTFDIVFFNCYNVLNCHLLILLVFHWQIEFKIIFSLFNTSLSLSVQVLFIFFFSGRNSDIYLLIWPVVAHMHFLHHGILWILLALSLKPLTILSTTLVTLDSVAAVCNKNEAEHVAWECGTV
jgi:hypothetical protein